MRFRIESWDESIQSTWDELIFKAVVDHNEYRLLKLDNANVLDIGAHIGSFAYIAHMSGASRIYCYEANRENFELLKENMRDFAEIEVHNYAVWRSDVAVDQVFFQWHLNRAMTGSGGVLFTEGIAVPAVKFDDIVLKIGTVDLLKIDAEGSEFPILFTSQRLNQINEIVGEYHEIYDIPTELNIEKHPQFTVQALIQHLQKSGFNVEFEHLAENLGKFHAWRPGVKLLSNLLILERSIQELKELAEVANVKAEEANAKAEVANVKAEEANAQLQSVYASYSWLITVPLRIIHRIYLHVRKKIKTGIILD